VSARRVDVIAPGAAPAPAPLPHAVSAAWAGPPGTGLLLEPADASPSGPGVCTLAHALDEPAPLPSLPAPRLLWVGDAGDGRWLAVAAAGAGVRVWSLAPPPRGGPRVPPPGPLAAPPSAVARR
jgi:hypothetical protein